MLNFILYEGNETVFLSKILPNKLYIISILKYPLMWQQNRYNLSFFMHCYYSILIGINHIIVSYYKSYKNKNRNLHFLIFLIYNVFYDKYYLDVFSKIMYKYKLGKNYNLNYSIDFW